MMKLSNVLNTFIILILLNWIAASSSHSIDIHVEVKKKLEEGSACNHTDGSPGICTVYSSCEFIRDLWKAGEFNRNQITECGFKGPTAIVCCPSPTQPGIKVAIIGTVKHKQYCEKVVSKLNLAKFDNHILHGSDANKGEFPHVGAIGYLKKLSSPEDKPTFQCGGSLISEKFFLTAAHCINPQDLEVNVVRLGRTRITEDVGDESDENFDGSPIVDVPVKETKHVKNYSRQTKYNDIGLLEFEYKVTFTAYIKPACLYSIDVNVETNAKATIVGWGLNNTDTRSRASWLQKAEIDEVLLDVCNGYYKTNDNYQYVLPKGLIQSQMCAKGTNEKGQIVDSCQGDSGGPLHVKTYMNTTEIFYVQGVISFGPSCGSEYPGVYTRVSEYIEWISKIVWPEK